MKKILNKPCKKCPYQLGEVKTLVNPCSECKENGYRMAEVFQEGRGRIGLMKANVNKNL